MLITTAIIILAKKIEQLCEKTWKIQGNYLNDDKGSQPRFRIFRINRGIQYQSAEVAGRKEYEDDACDYDDGGGGGGGAVAASGGCGGGGGHDDY